MDFPIILPPKHLALAEELGIKGVAIFKIDGGEDKDIWKLF